MLWQLSIKNLAIIDDINIEFGDGFNILTGETGAGKSIIIDAINLVLGARADRDLIRSGENMASVDAVFTTDSNTPLSEKLEELGLGDKDAGEVIISRQIYSNGRNVNRINSNPVATSTLKEISELLIDIHGQHQHQSLLNKAYHRGFLDAFEPEIHNISEKVAALYAEWHSLSKRIKDTESGADDYERTKELIEYQIDEISDARLKIGEDDELFEKKQIMKNAESIRDALEEGYRIINQGKRDDGALDYLRTVKEKLRTVSSYSDEYSELYETAENIYYELSDLSDSISSLLGKTSFSPDKLEEIDDRLYLIASLKRKYGKTIEAILDFCENLKKQLSTLEYNMGNLDELKKQEAEARIKLLAEADLLHEKRLSAAAKLRRRIVDELSYLGMKKVNFEAHIDADRSSVSENGYDNVEFLISANAGEPLRPLAKIASGGEISRIMLSIKSALADIDGIPTMIFDEIDTGISGAVARAAGEKMYALSKRHQIICITHQAQIAALADSHYFVSKAQKGEKTVTSVKILSENERTEHIAGMISGSTVTEAAKEHARELMKK